MAYLYKTPILPALLLILLSVTARAEPIDFTQIDPAEHTFDHWYLDTIDGKPAGYWRSSLTLQGDRLVSTYHEHRTEKHGGEKSVNDHRVVWTETKDFKPIEIVVTTEAGSDTVTKTYRFVEDGIELTSEQNGRSIQRKLPPIKGDYLTAAQASIASDLSFARNPESFELKTLDVNVGMTPTLTTYTRSKVGEAKRDLADGRAVNTQRWVATFAAFPGFEMQLWIDDSHRVVGVHYQVPPMRFESRLADKKVSDTIFDPPEMSGLSVVVPDRAIEDVHRQKTVVYELSYDAGALDVVPMTSAKQSVVALGVGKVRVTVDLDAKPRVADGDRPSDRHLASSIMIDHENELVRALAKRATAKLKPGATAEQIAMACKRFVTAHIRGASLAVGDGSASQAARTGEGDCTESAVLLAALLRVHDIPSRCVNGLVYSEDDFAGRNNVFVYHMWTQAWIAAANADDHANNENQAGYWLDLDSAMWRYSAGHIALGDSAMGDDDQHDRVKIVPMQQNLKIKVIETHP